MPSVSVVVCCYTEQRWEQLTRALSSVEHQRRAPTETVVVVDHNPALFARARAAFTSADVIESDRAAGLSGARNAGVARTTGDVVAFLDDDAAADPWWLECLAAAYDADGRVLGVGGKIDADWEQGRPPFFPPELDWVVGCTYVGLPTDRSEVRNLLGANMSLRRDVIDAVGGFREGIGRTLAGPYGCEETELCIRASRLWPDGAFVYEPGAVVRHWVPAERATWEYVRSRCRAEGVSKAMVAGHVGGRDALSSERRYATTTIPLGVARGLADAARGDAAGVRRAATLCGAVAWAASGYLAGRRARRGTDPLLSAHETETVAIP